MTAKHGNIKSVQRFACFLMMVSPGAAIAFYSAFIGFYVHHFGSRPFFAAMMVCLYAPCPLVCILQERFDEWFDAVYSANVTFFFRIVFMQLVLACLVLGWMFVHQTPAIVLSVGVCLGIIYSTVISSSTQMASTMDPVNVNYVLLGQQVGGLLPILAFFVVSFCPVESPLYMFKWVLLPLLPLCLVAVGLLSYFDFGLAIFKKGYDRLSHSISKDDLLTLDDGKGQEPPFDRGQSLESRQSLESQEESQPLIQTEGVPSWMTFWYLGNASINGVTAFMLSLSAFLGDARLAQSLSLCKLAVECLARIAAIPVKDMPWFEGGPCHVAFAGSLATLLSLCLVVFARLGGIAIPRAALLAAWSSYHFLAVFTGSFIYTTAAVYVPVLERKGVARRMMLLSVAFGFAGMLSALLILWGVGRVEGEWPAMNASLSE